MSIEKVREHFSALGIADRIMEFEVSSATVELAAKAVGVEGARIAKTLSFLVKDEPILIVVAGDGRVDNKKYKATFSAKAKMLSHDQAAEMIGHAVGGVCPFAVKETVAGIYIDESVKRFKTIFPACGSSNSAIELSPEELYELSNATEWVNVTKLIEV